LWDRGNGGADPSGSVGGSRRWRIWIDNLSDEEREQLRARDRERKRLERAKT